jgi:myo-inositol 2-dehydrogenase/D-chiro-inositol 1-dehydrogenase
MPEPLKVAVAGLGRMGGVHVQNIIELARDTGTCELVAVVDSNPDRAARFTGTCRTFSTIEELAASRICNATLVITPTEHHRAHATTLIRAGHRILLEKPLTGTLEQDREFAAELDRDHRESVMIAFQRRFDPALRYGRDLIRNNTIGRIFKIYSALEDSGPAPDGYQSGGILPDMSIHNVDEILWLAGQMPVSALAIGTRLYSHALSTCTEDFDDAVLYMWFEKELAAQVQVTRNHVAGYRVETIVYGEKGQVEIGRFAQKPEEIVVQAFGPRLSREPLAYKTFQGGIDQQGEPEFVARFKHAYKAEAAEFIRCCMAGEPFPITHNDALRAQTVIDAGMRKMLTRTDAAPVEDPTSPQPSRHPDRTSSGTESAHPPPTSAYSRRS